jgi:hypothetical protein
LPRISLRIAASRRPFCLYPQSLPVRALSRRPLAAHAHRQQQRNRNMPFANSTYSPGALGALRPGMDAQDHAPGRLLRAQRVPRVVQPEVPDRAVTANAAAVIEASAAAFAALPAIVDRAAREGAQRHHAQGTAPAPSPAGATAESAGPGCAREYAPHEPLPAWRRIQMLY